MTDSGTAGRRARGRSRSVQLPNPGQPGGRSAAPRSSRGPNTCNNPQVAWGRRPGGPITSTALQVAWGPHQDSNSGHEQQVPPPKESLGSRPAGHSQQPYHQKTLAVAPGQAGHTTGRQDDFHRTIENSGNIVVDSEGEASSSTGRGSVRGRRKINLEITTLITRPPDTASKKGESGKPIRLKANYFEMIGRTDWCLYQYRVDFAPEQDVTSAKKRLISLACKDKLTGYLFDGTMIFTSRRIQPDPMELFATNASGEPVRITIRLVGDVAQGDYHIIQFFNIIVRKCLSYMRLQLVGRNYYDASASIQISEYGIELWPGYITSIRQHESKILLCCEISHKFMRKENVLKILKEMMTKDRDYKKIFNKLIIGTVVLTDYNNRTYRIDDVHWEVTPKSTFLRRDGSTISYTKYYKERYQLRIYETQQPMLVSKAKPREIRAGMADLVYLVPEFCRMTGLTDRERSNMQMMRDLAAHTRLEPDGRQARLITFTQRMNNSERIVEELQNWDMQLAEKLVEFPARILPSETIIQGFNGRIRYPAGENADWTRNLRSNPMISLGTVQRWFVICPSGLKRDVQSFVLMLQKAAQAMALTLPSPQIKEISDDFPPTYVAGLDGVLSFNPNLILCVASNNKADRYAAIKKKCCVDFAVPTQVILKKNILSKGVMSIATKVAIQINCKLGGAPWTLEIPLSNLMVVGFDVCHDTMEKSKSFGAMVSSLDKQCTRYFSAVTAHTNGEELSNDFSLNIIKAAKVYRETNGHLPEKIIIYRDGVGDGQLPYVHSHEVKRIEEQLTAFYEGRPFKMAFIVVTKRINTRLFAGSKNPPPGTVVDDVVTLPQRYDFFIVSQCVRQGTVSPTSYNVIYDTLCIGPDKLQRITYKFTHMYYNWSGTVRVPAPCQYAHKLAFLVSQSLHRNPNAQLNNCLYFI